MTSRPEGVGIINYSVPTVLGLILKSVMMGGWGIKNDQKLQRYLWMSSLGSSYADWD
jgi:hypothetical protein